MREKVVLGFSGGVDSFFAASLLKRDYDVVPVFIRLGTFSDERRAKLSSELLNLKLNVIDASEDFKSYVMDYFIDYYKRGLTPNPCVVCNQKVKFRKLQEFADSRGIERIATGHYARVDFTERFKRRLIHRGRDRGKEQSYFLSMLNPDLLDRLLLPLGNFEKRTVVELSRKEGYPFSSESQDICFIDTTYYDFLRKFLKPEPGEIVLKDGTVLGRHPGILRFTIGQRKGLGIAYEKPLYVIALDPRRNRVIVGFKEDLMRGSIAMWKTVWHVPFEFIENFDNIHVQTRYRSRPVSVRSIKHLKKDVYRVELRSKVEAPAPGQVCAVYWKDVLLGGGEITAEEV